VAGDHWSLAFAKAVKEMKAEVVQESEPDPCPRNGELVEQE
jgi:hypothetical protein